MIRNLGQLTGQILSCYAAVDSALDDPITQASGCGDEMLLLWVKTAHRRVREILASQPVPITAHYWANEVEDRTSAKVAWELSVHWIADNVDPLPADALPF